MKLSRGMLRFHEWRGWWWCLRANNFPAGRKMIENKATFAWGKIALGELEDCQTKRFEAKYAFFHTIFSHLNTIWQWLKWYKLHSLFAFIQFGSFRCLQSVLMVQKRCFDWKFSLKENIKTFSAFLAFVEGRNSSPCIVAKREKSKYRINFVNTKVFFQFCCWFLHNIFRLSSSPVLVNGKLVFFNWRS